MRTLTIAAASALFLAAVITELTSRLWPGSYLAALIVAAIALFINGLFNVRLGGSSASEPQTAGKSAGQSRKRRSDTPAARPPRRESSRNRDKEPASTGGPRENGTVKWFNRTKGFGFVIRESGEEIFVHQRSIRSIGEGDQQRRPNLRDGQSVSFEVAKRDKGLQAEDVIPAD